MIAFVETAVYRQDDGEYNQDKHHIRQCNMGKIDQHRLVKVEMGPETIENDEEAAEYADDAEKLRNSNMPDGLIAPFCDDGGKPCDGTN